MLYAKEDRINNKLMFACRTCQYSEDAVSSCVFRNSIYNVIGETAGVTQDVGSDPTVGLPDVTCTLCGLEITCDICGGVNDYSTESEESQSSDEDEDEEADGYKECEEVGVEEGDELGGPVQATSAGHGAELGGGNSFLNLC